MDNSHDWRHELPIELQTHCTDRRRRTPQLLRKHRIVYKHRINFKLPASKYNPTNGSLTIFVNNGRFFCLLLFKASLSSAWNPCFHFFRRGSSSIHNVSVGSQVRLLHTSYRELGHKHGIAVHQQGPELVVLEMIVSLYNYRLRQKIHCYRTSRMTNVTLTFYHSELELRYFSSHSHYESLPARNMEPSQWSEYSGGPLCAALKGILDVYA